MTAAPRAVTVLPLAGATVIVTRAASRADELVAPLEALGAQVLSYATTRIVERDLDGLHAAARALARYDWVIFTSATAVSLTFDATDACAVTRDDWSHLRIAAVGAATASALRERGADVTVVPERFVAEALLEAMARRDDVAGSRMLYPTAAGARAVLQDGLAALGATVDRIDAYESVATHADATAVRAVLRNAETLGVVTLTAASAVDAWVKAMTPEHDRIAAVSLGPVTTQAARQAGMRVVAEAMPSTLDGLVAAVVRAIRAQRDHRHHQTPES